MKWKNIYAFIVGVVVHVLVWYSIIKYGLKSMDEGCFVCGELGCWLLFLIDFPVSYLYGSSNESVTYGSFYIGSLWWGLISFVIITLYRKIILRNSKNIAMKIV